MRGSKKSTCHQVTSWGPWQIVPCHGFKTGLYCWQVRPVEVMVPRLTLVSNIHAEGPLCSLYLWQGDYSLKCPSLSSQIGGRRLASVSWLNHFIIWMFIASSVVDAFWRVLIYHTNIFTLVLTPMYPSTFLNFRTLCSKIPGFSF